MVVPFHFIGIAFFNPGESFLAFDKDYSPVLHGTGVGWEEGTRLEGNNKFYNKTGYTF